MCQFNMILVTFGHWNHDGILINLVIQLLGCGVIYKELWGGSYVEVNRRKKKKKKKKKVILRLSLEWLS
jgi:hypothetical protein